MFRRAAFGTLFCLGAMLVAVPTSAAPFNPILNANDVHRQAGKNIEQVHRRSYRRSYPRRGYYYRPYRRYYHEPSYYYSPYYYRPHYYRYSGHRYHYGPGVHLYFRL